MQFIEWLKRCFEILFPCGCILLLVHGFLIAKHTSASSIQTTDNKESSDWLLVIYNLIAMIVLILVIYYFASIKGYKWLWLILVIPSLIQYANAILHSANEVGSIARSMDTKKLSYKEKTAIIVFAGIIWLIDQQRKSNLVIGNCSLFDSNHLNDLCIFLYYAWNIYIFSFLNCALLSFPAQLLLKLIQSIAKKAEGTWNHLISYLIKKTEGPTRNTLYIRNILNGLKSKKRILRLLLYILIPIVALVDLIITISVLLFSMLCSALLNALAILRFIVRFAMKPIKTFGGASDRRIVALSSRIAIVTTLVSIVVMNQIDSIFKNSTSSTAILEFIASAIIIPLVFEWISSMHATPSRDKEPE